MAQDNLSAPVTMSIISVPSMLSATATGAFIGAEQAFGASSNAMEELNSAKADSLLKAIEILAKGIKEVPDDEVPGLNNKLKEPLASTVQGAALSTGNLLLAPLITASHLAQLPTDVQIALEGILNSVENDYREFSQTKNASTFNNEQGPEVFGAHCNKLCDQLKAISRKLNKNIEDKLAGKKSAAKFHAGLAKKSARTATAPSLTGASAVATMADTIGTLFREISAVVDFSKQEYLHPQEKNIYKAFNECCAAFSEGKGSLESFLALRKLNEAIGDFAPAKEMFKKHSVSGPALSVFTRLLTAEPFVRTLIALNGSVLGVKIAAEEILRPKDEEFTQNVQESAPRASLIKGYSDAEEVTHSGNVTAFCVLFDDALKDIDNNLPEKFDHVEIVSSAKAAVVTNAALVIAPSLITGLAGMISREFSGSVDFTQNDKGSKDEREKVLQSRQELTGEDLDNLLKRVFALKLRLERSEELGVSAPVVLGVGEAITSGSMIASLNVLAGMYSALRELRTLAKSPSNPLILDEEEKLKAAQYVESVLNANQNTAQKMGSEDNVSENLSLHPHLASVMDKVVLTHRSRQDFIHVADKRQDINATGKASIAFSEGNSTGFLVGAAGVLTLAALQGGIATQASAIALQNSTANPRISDGVDRTQFDSSKIKLNISFMSNATRLIEESQKNRSLIQSGLGATAGLAESTFSRSLLVALCHSGALKEMLKRLVKQEEKKPINAPGYLDSAIISDALIPQLHDNILNVFKEAELNNDPIPHLNEDMAVSLETVSHAAIASALSTHSALISPFLKSIVVAKNAQIIPEDMKNEAVLNSELSRVISTALNNIQAFTKNLKPEMEAIENPIKNNSLIHKSDNFQKESMVLASAASLFCEELFEICLSRSLTLLDKAKIAKTAGESREKAEVAAEFSCNGVVNDSGNNLGHAISALRLTLSHLGIALGEFALGMDLPPDLLQDNLKLHSSQHQLMKSMVSVFSLCSKGMLSLAGILSALPLSSAESVNTLRDIIHSMDKELIIRPVDSSEALTNDSNSQSTLLTGIGTDSLISILLSATKLLFQASIMGLDTSLSIAKILEILCINPRPDEALSLETQAMSQPNGFTANLNEQIQRLLIQGSIGSASVCAATQTGKSSWTKEVLDALQAGVDKHIEQIALLADDEEGEKLGLLEFYELLIRTLVPTNCKEEDYEDLTMRLHRGGINLSSFHSAPKEPKDEKEPGDKKKKDHGGIFSKNRQNSHKNPLIVKNSFLGGDNAAALLEIFINKAVREEQYSSRFKLLDTMKLAMMGKQLSAKSIVRWEYIVNQVAHRLQSHLSYKSFFNLKPVQESWEDRKNKLLNNWTYQNLDSGSSSDSLDQEKSDNSLS
ncbi:MAG: hypothetical protein Q8M03_13365 [Legionella sp.]|nr:hypothetical protein [Legionella sp.]